MKEEKKLPTLKLGGREIPLYYSTYEAIAIQKDIGCTVFQLNDEVFGIYQEDEDDPTSMRFGIIEDAEKQIKLGTLGQGAARGGNSSGLSGGRQQAINR